jgi:hypothetical protein
MCWRFNAFEARATALRVLACFSGGMRAGPPNLARESFVATTTSTGFVKWVRMVFDFGRSAVVDSHPGQ